VCIHFKKFKYFSTENLKGCIVTIDAMGCQRVIAQKIIDKKADYIFALKGNQGSLRHDVNLFVAEQKANDFSNTTITRHQTVDGDHVSANFGAPIQVCVVLR
jgi:predicted transposase YbfD/YdcC